MIEAWIAKGLVSKEDLVDGVALLVMPRRNRNQKLERTDKSGLLSKKAGPGAQATLAIEGAFYRACQRQPRMAELSDLVPDLHSWNSERSTLLCELLPDALPLDRIWRQSEDEQLALEPSAALGRALGRVHGAFPDGQDDLQKLLPLPSQRPGVFRLHRPSLETRRNLSQAQAHCLRIVQQETEWIQRLESSSEEWLPMALIHGDIRSDNVLFAKGEPGSLCLVDWELVQWGDPAWDLGAAIREHLGFWLRSMPLASELDAEARLQEAEVSFPALQRGLRSFWDAYAEAVRLDEAEAIALGRRSLSFASVQLLRWAWEMAANRQRLTSLSVLALQMAANISADIEEGMASLLTASPLPASRTNA